MNTFRIVILAMIALSLVGCATKDIFNTTREIDVAGTCRHLKNEDGKVNNVTHSTSEKKDVYEQTPSKSLSGIKSVNINNSILTISLVNKDYFEQFSVPLVETIQQTTYDGHPIRASIATIMYIGIPWLITDHFSDLASGCTEEKSHKNPDLTRKTKTGKSEWRDIQKTHKILISGFDKDYERSSSSDQIEYDLSPYILNTELTKNMTVKITCLDCDLLGQQEQSLYNDVKKTVEFSTDFRAIKTDLLAEDKARKTEQAKLDKKAIIEQGIRDEKAAIQRAIEAKEDLIRKKQNQGVPLDEFKVQCQVLGFKLGSPDFGNCVLELNEIK